MDGTPEHNDLMAKRIRRILLVCNNYDSFALEEDGRIEEQISREYFELNLSNPPAIVRAETTQEALDIVEGGESFDLTITMYSVGEVDVFEFSHRMKALAPDTPIVLLTAFSRVVYKQIEESISEDIDYFFCWNNSTDLIIAIIKLLEDRLNADQDIIDNGVQAILLVEDSVRYYSAYLPLLYKLVLQQNSESIKDALNEKQQMLRKRSRPKILLATNFTDAVNLYQKYTKNILGVITDVGFVLHKGDKSEDEKSDAGVDLCNIIRADNPKMPILMQSSQESMREVAQSLHVGFVIKKSKTLTHELSEYIENEFGFGDFVVRSSDTGEEIGRASDLNGVEKVVNSIPLEELYALFDRNYVSKWLLARGIFSIGKKIQAMSMRGNPQAPQIITGLIRDYRMGQGLGVVARFDKDTYNDAIRFVRFGDGSLGGKARGLAFMNHLLQKYNLYDQWEGVRVLVPKTFVATTDQFDTFIKSNGLHYVINSDISDEEILSEFVASSLPVELMEALRIFVRHTHKPLAVRSSSKLEDSHYQPFAGVYSTYMVPHTDNEDQQLRLLSKAIKSVYASVYFASSRAYITATGNVISEEKMAVIVQEICGTEDQGYYFPTLSGVARSINFYPIGGERPEEGIVKLAFGLGKSVVDGDEVLRFSPQYPGHVLQTSTPELTMSDTQRQMYALDLRPDKFKTSVDDSVNLVRLGIQDCTKFRNIKYVASTFDYENMRIVDSALPQGPKFVTFAHILKYNTFPLADIVKTFLEISQRELHGGVEIEFAADLDTAGHTGKLGQPCIFNVLQIRPISLDSKNAEVDWSKIDESGAIVRSLHALGTGWIEGVRDVIYLKPDAFNVLKTSEMASQISRLNSALRDEPSCGGYVLIGFGRWGSSISSLGVPVRWSDISEAKAIVESTLGTFRVDPSQGTHFFQNLTSFNVGYINIDPERAGTDEILDLSQLDSLPALDETEYLRHVRLEQPLSICVDGRTGKAIIKLSI